MNEIQVKFSSPNEVLEFVNKVTRYPYDMDLKRGSVIVDAKSLLGVINLGLNSVVNLQVYADECEELCRDIQSYIAA